MPGRGAVALLLLALLASLAAAMPPRGETLGLMCGIAGSLAVGLIVPGPERRPLLALAWSALAFALPVTLTLARPDLPLAMALAMGAAGLWSILAFAARSQLPAA